MNPSTKVVVRDEDLPGAGLPRTLDFGPNLRARLRVDNLTDKAYETLIGFPGKGRSLRLGLGYGY